VLRVARTIADLDADAEIGTPHVAEALGYRPRGADAPAEGVRAAAIAAG
jgi:predicted ATPase with chaperone activity